MSSYPKISLIFDRKKTAPSTGAGTVEARVTWQGSRVYFSTGVKLRPGAWDTKQRLAKGAGSSAVNYRLRAVLDRLEAATAGLWRSGDFSLEAMKSTIRPVKTESLASPCEWMRDQVKRRSLRESTRRQHLVMVDNLERSGLFASWGDFTLASIERWDEQLRARAGVTHQSTVHGYHKRLKPYLRIALRHGLIKSDPYDLFKSPRGERGTVDYLTEVERDAIDALHLDGMLDKARDLFIFSCYTGLSYADMAAWDDSLLVQGDGVTYIVGQRQKTGERYITVLPVRAREILKKWGGALPALSNQKCNMALKLIAAAAGIKKRVTLHMARHTFATWELHNGIDIKTVSKTLGHSSVVSTEIYAKSLDEDVKRSIEKLGKK